MAEDFLVNKSIQIAENFGIDFVRTEFFKSQIPKLNYEFDKSPILRKSRLGTPIFSDLQFQDIVLPNGTKLTHTPIDIALFELRLPKQIIETNIAGRDESVKEYICRGSYEITIRTLLNGRNGEFPKAQFLNTIEYLRDANVSIPITSEYLNDIGIYDIVIFDAEFGMEEGVYSQQRIQIFAKSDKPIELKITDNSINTNNIV